MQQIIVIIIGVIVFGIICWRIYRLLTGKASDAGRCAGCEVDCSLRNIKMAGKNTRQNFDECKKGYK